MRIGVLGSGLMGSKLGALFVRAGHGVVFSYSHSEKKLRRLATTAATTGPHPLLQGLRAALGTVPLRDGLAQRRATD